MSEYVVLELEMNDAECIKSALIELGYIYEEHENPQNLFGFQSDQREQVANIIVRRKNIGSVSNDMGFLRKSDGNYQLIISEYDQKTRTGQSMQKIKQLYGAHKFIKTAKKLGYKIKSSVNKSGLIKIKVVGY